MAGGRPKLNATAAGEMVAALAGLTAEHEALVVAVKALARAVDEEPKNASLWREYRAALADLREAVASGDVDDVGEESAGFLESVRTPLGNAS